MSWKALQFSFHFPKTYTNDAFNVQKNFSSLFFVEYHYLSMRIRETIWKSERHCTYQEQVPHLWNFHTKNCRYSSFFCSSFLLAPPSWLRLLKSDVNVDTKHQTRVFVLSLIYRHSCDGIFLVIKKKVFF